MKINAKGMQWSVLVLLAALLLSGCALGERARGTRADEAPAQATAVSQPDDPLESDLNDLDKALDELEQELRSIDTQVEIP